MLHKRQDGPALSSVGKRVLPALGKQAQSSRIAHGQQARLGCAFHRRTAGPQAMNQLYLDTAKLLTQVAPLVFQEGVFALKGGTAINLFLRDMPRLSVDLDLVFPDYTLPRT